MNKKESIEKLERARRHRIKEVNIRFDAAISSIREGCKHDGDECKHCGLVTARPG